MADKYIFKVSKFTDTSKLYHRLFSLPSFYIIINSLSKTKKK